MNMKVEKEREKINQRWKGEYIWKWERKGKKWLNGGKEDIYKSGKEKVKNDSKVERSINMKVGKERERINYRWKGE